MVTLLRGGLGNNIVTTRPNRKQKRLDSKAVENARAKLEQRLDAEADAEAIAMKRHREIRPDRQKIAF